MIVLGIESSCDDLSMAILSQGKVLANVTASQVKIHAPYGGVVPEIASREHLQALELTLQGVLQRAGVKLSQIDGVGATYAPGLVGSLLVGLNFGKALAFALNVPFRGIHHIEAHLWSAFLENEISFPCLALIVSGGHSHIFLMEGLEQYQLLGQTVDDAAGEAFDKVGKILGLPYPGGPQIDRLATKGDPHAFTFALPRVKQRPLDTSFSGLKTAAFEYVRQAKEKTPVLSETFKNDMSASFQTAVVRALLHIVQKAYAERPTRKILLGGGVACNRGLRASLGEWCLENSIELVCPSPKYCTDNGAMVGFLAEKYLQNGDASPLSLNAKARLPLGK